MDKYYIRLGEGEYREVPRAEWISAERSAERSAGFRPKLSSTDPRYNDTCATGGFSGNGISGRIEYAKIG
jgi:hypothetical protein